MGLCLVCTRDTAPSYTQIEHEREAIVRALAIVTVIVTVIVTLTSRQAFSQDR